MPLMGSLYIGSSGLQTSQNALNTTAHNLSNIDTTGYTRQQILLGTRPYHTLSKNASAVANKQIGLGVNYSKVRQVRDYFLDKTYRRESGRSMFYEVSSGVMEEVEGLLGEMNGEAFQNSLENLWASVQELAKDPSSSVTQGLLVHRASAFIERAGAVYNGMVTYQNNLNTQVYNMVNKINDYGKKISELNDRIRSIEVGGVESPNDLKDARNQLIDELAQMASITYSEDLDGSVSIKIEGMDFVKRDNVYLIDMKIDATTGFYTPFWQQNAEYRILADGSKEYDIDGAEVFNLHREISSDLDTDIGGLKAILLARGDHRADYTDINNGKYDTDISQSVLMNVQAEFDQLIHNVVTKINEILAEASDPQTHYLCNEDGSPLQLFQKIGTPGYEQVTDAAGNTSWQFVAEDSHFTETLYSIKNLRINPALLQEPSKLGFIKADGSVDYETANALKEAFKEQAYTLNPNVQKRTCFVDYYDDLVAQVANSGSIFRSISDNQTATVEATFSAREQIVGVSSDEELSNMIKFQNAYNASSRYINVISEMLEHIIRTLAM